MKEMISKFVFQLTQVWNVLSAFALLEQPNSDFPLPMEENKRNYMPKPGSSI